MNRSRFRLRKKWEFQKIYEAQQKIVLHNVIIFFRTHDDPGLITRFGVAVSKKVGTAVTRNKFKRQLREIFYRLQSEIGSDIDLVFVAKRAIHESTFAQLWNEIENGLRESGLLYNTHTR